MNYGMQRSRKKSRSIDTASVLNLLSISVGLQTVQKIEDV